MAVFWEIWDQDETGQTDWETNNTVLHVRGSVPVSESNGKEAEYVKPLALNSAHLRRCVLQKVETIFTLEGDIP